MDEMDKVGGSSADSGGRAEGEGATAVGERGVYVKGDVGGDIRTGDTYVFIDAKSESGAPLQLPPRAEHFTGREDDLARLITNLQPGRAETIVGPGGMGKTALAAETLWRLHESGDLLSRFPGGLIFHTFYNQPEADVALEHIARSFDVDPGADPAGAARHALSGKTALLLLDGAEAADDLPAVLAVRGACGLLITTRQSKDAPGDWERLDPLPQDEAVRLLREWAGDYAAEEAAAGRVAELVGRLPLAVRLAGRYMREESETAADYLTWLEPSPLDALNQGDRQHQSVPHLLERSLDRVGETTRQAMAVAGLLALAPFERSAMAAALEMEANAARRPLGELTRFGISLALEKGRFQTSHALVHTYARKRLHPPDGALERLAAYYQNLVEEQNALGAAGHARLDLDRPHLMALLRRLSEREAWPPLLALADPVAGFGGYLELSGRWSERIEACNLALAAARAAGERWQEANWLNNLALAHAAVGRLPEAIGYYEETAGIFRELEDRGGEGAALGNLGSAYADLGRYDEAIDYLQQALAIQRDIGDRRNEGNQLGGLGNAYYSLGRTDEAIDSYEQALAISREIGDRRNEGNQLGNLGNAYADLGRYDEAIDSYEKALAIQRDIGDRRGEGATLGNLGNAYGNLGRNDEAIDYCEKALAIQRDIGNRRGEGNSLGNLGIAYHSLGRYDEAIDYHNQALVIARDIGHRRGEGSQLGNLGNAYADLGRYDEAIDSYEQALAIQRDIGDRQGECNQLGNLGNAYRTQGETEKAIELHRQGLALAREMGDRTSQAYRLYELGLDHREIRRADETREYLEEALAISEELRIPLANNVRQALASLNAE